MKTAKTLSLILCLFSALVLAQCGTGKQMTKQKRTEPQISRSKTNVAVRESLRSVNRFELYNVLREQMDAKLKQDKGKAIYKERSTDVEPVFDDIKTNILGSSGFLLRGLKKAGGEFTLSCITHNIKNINNYLKSDKNDKELKHIKEFALKFA